MDPACQEYCEEEKKNGNPGGTDPDPITYEPGAITKQAISWEGNFEEKADGTVAGTGTISFQLSCDRFALEVEDANIRFDSDSVFQGLTGKVNLKESDDCFLVGVPNNASPLFQADVFFHTGGYLNNTYDLPFKANEDQEFFVLAAKSNLNLGLCNDDSTGGVNDALSFDLNLGQIIFMVDLCDPMAYIEGGAVLLGNYGMGNSLKGAFNYVPTMPVVGEIEEFGAKSVRRAKWTYQEIFSGQGTFFYGRYLSASLVKENFLESQLDLEYKTAFNGEFSIAPKIMDKNNILSIPVGSGSISLQEYLGTSGIGMRFFFNGLMDPFEGWWPDVIPFKPIRQEQLSGYFISDPAQLNLTYRSKVGIKLPQGESVVSGENSAEVETVVSTDELSINGNFMLGDNEWNLRASVVQDETELSAGVPSTLLNDFRNVILTRVGISLEPIDAVRIDYLAAFDDYQLALDLDGLRDQIPVITANARNRINAGVTKGRSEVDRRLPAKLCTSCSYGNVKQKIYNWIDDIADDYRKVVDDLDAAVADSLTDAQARQALETALRALVAKDKLRGTKTFGPFCIDSGFPLGCIKDPTRTTVTINLGASNIVILTANEVNTLNQAIANIPRIPSASSHYLDVKKLYDQLKPEEDRLKGLRAKYEDVTQPLPELARAGYIKVHDTGVFRFFYDKPNGQRVVMNRQFDPFDFNHLVDALFDL